MLTLQAVVQILFFLRHGDIELFSSFFVENTLFILLGLSCIGMASIILHESPMKQPTNQISTTINLF